MTARRITKASEGNGGWMRFVIRLCRILPPFMACRIKHTWLDRRLLYEGNLRCKPLFCRNPVMADFGEEVDRSMAVVGSNNFPAMAAAATLLSVGDTVYEFGANVGTETLSLASLVCETGRVVAVEADGVNAAKLEARLAEANLKNVSIVNRAVCSIPGSVVVSRGPAHKSGMSFIREASDHVPDSFLAATIETIRGDDLLSLHPPPAFMMMDIEGSELSALESCQRILSEARPAVVLEVNKATLAKLGATPDTLLRFLFDREYRVFNLADRRLPAVERRTLLTDMKGMTDWLCLPAERAFQERRLRQRLLAARVLPRLRAISPLWYG